MAARRVIRKQFSFDISLSNNAPETFCHEFAKTSSFQHEITQVPVAFYQKTNQGSDRDRRQPPHPHRRLLGSAPGNDKRPCTAKADGIEMPRSVPQVARVEDYDSDESSVKPGTRKEARRKTTISGPPKSLARYQSGQKDGASDSGYSSHASGTQANKALANAQAAAMMPPPPRPGTSQGQSKSKPVIHRSDTDRSRPNPPSRSKSSSRQSITQCDDRNCRHPPCLAVRHGYAAAQQYTAQYAPQYASSPAQYQQQVAQYQYQYAQIPQATTSQTVPTLTQPQPRQRSTSRQARPVSIHGYSYPSSFNGNQAGPPPANSAYQNAVATAWAQYYQQMQAYQHAAQAATPQTPTIPQYTQASPVKASPTSPNYATAPALQRTYSARGTPATAGYGSSRSHQHPPLNRATSARQPSNRTSGIPGAYPREDQESSETDSDSDSSSEMSSGEYERERRARARDSRLMSSSSQRRPSIKRQHATAPVVPTISSREVLHRNTPSEHVLDYISSSDNMDSDRTARAVVDRPRTTYTGSSRSSRRPSVSTTASSNRTKATTVSSAASGLASLVLEGKSGRHISYLSKRDQAALLEDQHRRQQEASEAYQDYVSGQRGPELTAENIRTMQQFRSSGSYFSGLSRRGSRSSSKVPGGSEGIKIESGGTVIHVYGDSKIEMRPGEDGAPAQFVIGGGASSRDSAYHGSSSKSSSSRMGRSRGGSDIAGRRKDSIQEEVGVEQTAT